MTGHSQANETHPTAQTIPAPDSDASIAAVDQAAAAVHARAQPEIEQALHDNPMLERAEGNDAEHGAERDDAREATTEAPDGNEASESAREEPRDEPRDNELGDWMSTSSGSGSRATTTRIPTSRTSRPHPITS